MPVVNLNRMLIHSNGKLGLRSKSLVEIYGPAASGKTQIYLNLAVLYLKQFQGKIIYFDTEGAFEASRFENLTKSYNLSDYSNRVHNARIDNFDEHEYAIKQAELDNYGLIIIDSIIDPLQSQYPLGGENLDNLVLRQQHLKRVMDKLKFFARTQNAIVVYTNHVRASFEDEILVPQGGNTLSHASDIRIQLTILEKYHQAKVVDCGFLPALSGKYMISRDGLVDYVDNDQNLEMEEIIV